MDRRRFLEAVGPPTIVSVAGCSRGGDAESPTGSAARTASAVSAADGETTAITDSTVIDEPGGYELTEDLSSGGTCIEITADDVTLDGSGHTIQGEDPGSDQHGIRVTGDAVTVSTVVVKGWNENGAGILYEGVEGGEISNVTAAGNSHGIRLASASNTRIAGSELAGSDEFGVLADASENTTVEGNTVRDNAESGILLWESAGNRIARNTVRDNELRNNLGGIHLDGDRTGSDGNEVVDNELRNNGDTAVILIDSDENGIADNRMEGNDRHGVFLEGASTNTLEGNTATRNAISGIDLAWGSDRNTIEANTLEGNDGHGVWLIDSHGNDMRENSAIGNDQLGIILADSSENSIVGNTVTDNRQGGIDLIGESEYTSLVGSHDNEVVGNEVRANEGAEGSGIRLLHSDENTIRGNAVVETADHGITLFDSTANEVLGNTIRANEYDGIHLEVAVEGLVVRSNVVEGNGSGVAVGVEASGDPMIADTEIVDNEDFGVVVRDMHTDAIPDESDEIEDVDATQNWWGHGTGPAHPRKNPSGRGDRVGDNVDFEPWKTRNG